MDSKDDVTVKVNKLARLIVQTAQFDLIFSMIFANCGLSNVICKFHLLKLQMQSTLLIVYFTVQILLYTLSAPHRLRSSVYLPDLWFHKERSEPLIWNLSFQDGKFNKISLVT